MNYKNYKNLCVYNITCALYITHIKLLLPGAYEHCRAA